MNTTGSNDDVVSTMGGWVCSDCGFFVPAGTLHYCQRPYRRPYVGGTYGATDLAEISRKLDRIIELLELLNKGE